MHWRILLTAALLVGLLSAAGCSRKRPLPAIPSSRGQTAPLPQSDKGRAKPAPIKPGEHQLEGAASWYGKPYHGRKTASGETYDMHDFTAAHRTLPFGTVVRVENEENHLTVVVRINDRGPFKDDRVIDLSYAAAKALEMITSGLVRVRIVILGAEETKP